MARQPTPDDLGGLPNIAGARPVGTYDVSPYARGAHEIAQAGARLGQAVEGVGESLHQVAAQRDQTQYINAISRGITRGLDLHAQLRTSADADGIEQKWQDGTRRIIDEEAATIGNPVLQEGLRAKLAADFARQQDLIAEQAFKARAASSLAHIAQDRQDLINTAGVDADPLHNAKIVAHNALIDTAERNNYLTLDAALEEKRRSAQSLAVVQYANMARVDPDRAISELTAPGGNPVLSVLSPQQKDGLLDNARRLQQAQIADVAIAEHRRLEQARQLSSQAEFDTIQNLFSPNPTVTANDIANNPNLSHDAKVNMLAVAERTANPDPPATISNATARLLLDRIRTRDGDPAKVTSLDPIYAAYVRQQLDRGDFLFVTKEFLQSRSPEGEHLLARKQAFIKAIDHTIDRSDPLAGKIDHAGRLQMYRLERDLDQKIEEYRKAGKNPLALFDPAKPDYFGKPETLLTYRQSLQQQADDRARSLLRGSEPNSASAPSNPSVSTPPQRIPGETPAEYLRRVPVVAPAATPRVPTDW